MKIAIIGGTGFIGSNLIKYLPKKHKIIATYINKKKINKKLIGIKNIKWKYLDIYKKKNFFKYLENPDLVLHFGWSNLPNYQLKFHLKKELPKQKKFIYNLLENGLRNIFIASTCFEYGNQSGKLSEITKEKPNNSYSLAKYKLKNYTFSLLKKFNFNLVWGRIFYIYGKHNSRATLYNQILNSSKKKNKEIEVYGNLVRDYLNIDKISKIIINLIFKKKSFGLVNICSGKGTSLKNLIKKITKEEKITAKINYKNYTKVSENDEVVKFWGCNKKLKQCLRDNN